MDYISKTTGLGETAPCQRPCGDLVFLAKAWLAQQSILQRYAERRFRIDEFKIMFKQICHDSAFPADVCNSDLLPQDVDNHRPHEKVTWAAIKQMNPQVQEMLLAKAREYGFNEACTTDSFRARGTTVATDPKRVVTPGFFGTESSLERSPASEIDGTDGLDWVWDRDVFQRALSRRTSLQL